MKKLVFICILLSCKGFAQQLTLQDAINVALKNSFDIQIAKNNVEINTINNHIGMAGGLPTVTASASDQESVVNINQKLNTGVEISRNGATSNNLSANVSGSMLLYNGYRVVATKKRLEQLQLQSEQLLNAQIQNTIAAVMVKYYDVVRQQGYIKTLQQSIELSQKQLELVQVKQNIGLANNADLFQTQIALNTRQQDLQAQQLIVQQTKTDLLNLLNLNPDSTISINDTIVTTKNILLVDVMNGIEQNPQIISLDQQVKISELIEKETASLRAPSLRTNLGLNYGRNQATGGQLLLNQTYGPFVNIGITIPIYSGGTVKRQERTANINTQNAKLQKQNVLLDFKATTVRTFQSYTGNIEQAITQKNTYEISAKLVNLVLQRYQLAQATIIELTEAQRSFEDAGYRLTNLNYNAKIAEIELKRLSGKLGF
ncbi:MAG TPA: TolC family protein [Chitinophagaceae bacterium]|jgi:outer membrane protein TolC|nr:TolC family protein [Chitinophagaceae bacterium]MBP9740906.1 TolC family protein [Chitinophagaceae bacterium]HPH22468.1 TolC family protein [Chitinophagaceae bacterium]